MGPGKVVPVFTFRDSGDFFKSGCSYFIFFLVEHIFERSGLILVNNCDRKSPKEALGKYPE